MTTKKLIAVDVGSGFTKAVSGDTYINFQSVASPFPSDEFFSANELDAIVVNGVVWVIGDSAINSGKKEDRKDSLLDEWAGSDGWVALLFAAIAQLGGNGPIELITGIPQGQYADKVRREAIISSLQGNHEFKWKGVKTTVEISRVLIIPQAAATLFFWAQKDETILDDVVGVIDIGTYTTGLSVMKKSNFSQSRSGSISLGVSNLIQELVTHLKREYGYHLDKADAPTVLMTKKIKNRDKVIDISSDISVLAKRVVRPMQDAIDSIWGGGNDLTIYVAGGGANYFIDALLDILPHAKVMQDNFYAVVTGMIIFLENQDRSIQSEVSHVDAKGKKIVAGKAT